MKNTVLSRLLFIGVATLLPALTADAQSDYSKHKPDLADVAQGTYFGDVISDSKGSSQNDVTVTVTRINKNQVRITSNYPRLPTVEVPLAQAMDKVLNAGGATTFFLDQSKNPLHLDISFKNEVSWSGVKK